MLAKKYRLTGRRNFELIKEKGKLVQSPIFGVSYFKRDDLLPSRFGFIVSTKISKKATVRNKVRRQLKRAVKKFLPKVSSGFDILFLAKRSIMEREGKELEREVKKALERMRVIK